MTETTATFSVQSADTIQELNPTEWDALAPNDVMASHAWLSAVEAEPLEGIDVRYLVVRQGGKIVAGAPCYLCWRRHRLFDPDRLLFGRARRLAAGIGVSFLPAMLVGPYLSSGPGLLVSDTLSGVARDRVYSELLSKIETLATQLQLPIHLPSMLFDARRIASLLTDRGYLWTRDRNISYLDVEWATFEEYLQHLNSFSRNMRRNVRKEMNRLERSGIEIDVIRDPARHLSTMLQILNDHFRRLGATDFPYSGGFLSNLKESLGEDCVFYGAFDDGGLVGVALVLKKGNTACTPWMGIDTRWLGKEAIHFNLSFYRPIQDAIAAGLDRLNFGKTNQAAKVRRGCRLAGMSYFYKANSRLGRVIVSGWFWLHRTWMGHKDRHLDLPPRFPRDL